MAKWIIHLARNPQSVEQYGKLPRHGHHGTFLCNFTAASSPIQPLAAKVGVFTERTQDIVCRLNQQAAKVAVAGLGYPEFRIPLPRLTLLGPKTQIGSHGAALLEAPWVLEGQDVAKRRQRTHSINLPKELRFRIWSLAEYFDLLVLPRNLDVEGAQRLEHGK